MTNWDLFSLASWSLHRTSNRVFYYSHDFMRPLLTVPSRIFGVTNVQCFMYFNTYSRRDPLYLKAIVCSVFALSIPFRLADILSFRYHSYCMYRVWSCRATVWAYAPLFAPFRRILDWMQLIFASHGVYTYTISNFANISFLTSAVWSIVVSTVLTVSEDLKILMILFNRHRSSCLQSVIWPFNCEFNHRISYFRVMN